MGNDNTIFFATNLFVSIILICCVSRTLSHGKGNAPLKVGFYSKSCPQAERIVQENVIKALINDSSLAPSLLRLFFHDCFVNGCDASILLDETPSGERIEKTSPGNIGVRGFELIDEIKSQLETACPNTVSCADIISFATRDASTISGIVPYEVPAGRRDGVRSLESNVFGNLPVPDSNVMEMTDIFIEKGMNKSDLVTLLGAHAFGVAHCFLFDTDFYKFDKTRRTNPRLNEGFAVIMRTICPAPHSPRSNKDNMFPLNVLNLNNKLSTMFYSNVEGGRVVIPADQSLLDDEFSSRMVRKYVTAQSNWANDFRKAMVKLGHVDVLTGEQGQIRTNCRAVNN